MRKYTYTILAFIALIIIILIPGGNLIMGAFNMPFAERTPVGEQSFAELFPAIATAIVVLTIFFIAYLWYSTEKQ